jgi:hypothetical protein
MLLNDFAKEGLFVANDLAAQCDVQILERHREQVSAMQAAQNTRRGLARASVSDAVEIAVCVRDHGE